MGVLIGTLLPYLLISYVLTEAPSSVVAQFVYLQALVACFLGFGFLGEALSLTLLFSAILIFLGLYLSLAQHPFGIRLK
jgi:drug/metabolite transporter (DMT)-like permease